MSHHIENMWHQDGSRMSDSLLVVNLILMPHVFNVVGVTYMIANSSDVIVND
jgi:hypothetical protein